MAQPLRALLPQTEIVQDMGSVIQERAVASFSPRSRSGSAGREVGGGGYLGMGRRLPDDAGAALHPYSAGDVDKAVRAIDLRGDLRTICEDLHGALEVIVEAKALTTVLTRAYEAEANLSTARAKLLEHQADVKTRDFLSLEQAQQDWDRREDFYVSEVQRLQRELVDLRAHAQAIEQRLAGIRLEPPEPLVVGTSAQQLRWMENRVDAANGEAREARNIASRRRTELAAVSAAEARLRDELRHARGEWLQESAAAAGHRGVIRAKEEEAELTYGEVLLGQDARRDLQESRSERRALEESMSSAEATLAQQRLELQQKAGRFATLTEHVDRLEKEVAGLTEQRDTADTQRRRLTERLGTSEAEVQLVENRLTVQLKRELYLTERTLEAKEKTFHSEVADARLSLDRVTKNYEDAIGERNAFMNELLTAQQVRDDAVFEVEAMKRVVRTENSQMRYLEADQKEQHKLLEQQQTLTANFVGMAKYENEVGEESRVAARLEAQVAQQQEELKLKTVEIQKTHQELVRMTRGYELLSVSKPRMPEGGDGWGQARSYLEEVVEAREESRVLQGALLAERQRLADPPPELNEELEIFKTNLAKTERQEARLAEKAATAAAEHSAALAEMAVESKKTREPSPKTVAEMRSLRGNLAEAEKKLQARQAQLDATNARVAELETVPNKLHAVEVRLQKAHEALQVERGRIATESAAAATARAEVEDLRAELASADGLRAELASADGLRGELASAGDEASAEKLRSAYTAAAVEMQLATEAAQDYAAAAEAVEAARRAQPDAGAAASATSGRERRTLVADLEEKVRLGEERAQDLEGQVARAQSDARGLKERAARTAAKLQQAEGESAEYQRMWAQSEELARRAELAGAQRARDLAVELRQKEDEAARGVALMAEVEEARVHAHVDRLEMHELNEALARSHVSHIATRDLLGGSEDLLRELASLRETVAAQRRELDSLKQEVTLAAEAPPMERIVEVPVEKVIEVPVEKIVEVPSSNDGSEKEAARLRNALEQAEAHAASLRTALTARERPQVERIADLQHQLALAEASGAEYRESLYEVMSTTAEIDFASLRAAVAQRDEEAALLERALAAGAESRGSSARGDSLSLSMSSSMSPPALQPRRR